MERPLTCAQPPPPFPSLPFSPFLSPSAPLFLCVCRELSHSLSVSLSLSLSLSLPLMQTICESPTHIPTEPPSKG